MKVKKCNECERLLPATLEFFNKEPNNRSGLFGRCRECNKRKSIFGGHSKKAKSKNLISDLTPEQWEAIKKIFNNKCAYCGMSEEEHLIKWNGELNQEHIIPTTKGGGYTKNNIIPSCKLCNSSKRNFNFYEWYPNYNQYNKERENKIIEYIEKGHLPRLEANE